MLLIFYGEDFLKIQNTLNEYLSKGWVAFPYEEVSEKTLEASNSSQSLFSENISYICKVHDEASFSDVLSFLQNSGSVQKDYVFIFKKLTAVQLRKIPEGVEVRNFETASKNTYQNIFKLTDYLLLGDKKNTWLYYRQLVGGKVSPEEIAGVLFWFYKNILLVMKSSSNPGLKPYVYQKYKKSKLGSRGIDKISKDFHLLIEIYHKARTEGLVLEGALEEYILSR